MMLPMAAACTSFGPNGSSYERSSAYFTFPRRTQNPVSKYATRSLNCLPYRHLEIKAPRPAMTFCSCGESPSRALRRGAAWRVRRVRRVRRCLRAGLEQQRSSGPAPVARRNSRRRAPARLNSFTFCVFEPSAYDIAGPSRLLLACSCNGCVRAFRRQRTTDLIIGKL